MLGLLAWFPNDIIPALPLILVVAVASFVMAWKEAKEKENGDDA
jgi:hypothetical protein